MRIKLSMKVRSLALALGSVLALFASACGRIYVESRDYPLPGGKVIAETWDDPVDNLKSQDHLIQIHTGSDTDHSEHTDRVRCDPYTDRETGLTGATALDVDLLRAQRRMADLQLPTNVVRPVKGYIDNLVVAAYGEHLLAAADHDRGANGIAVLTWADRLGGEEYLEIGRALTTLTRLLDNGLVNDSTRFAELVTRLADTADARLEEHRAKVERLTHAAEELLSGQGGGS